MQKFSVFVLVAVVLLALVPATHAQSDSSNSITLSESYINGQIQARMPATEDLSDLYMDLQPGQVVVTAIVTVEETDLDLLLVMVPVVNDGRINWTITALSIGGIAMDVSQFQSSNTASNLNGIVSGAAEGRPIETVTITHDSLTISWYAEGANFTITNTEVSITLTEKEVNEFPGVAEPANPALTDLAVDFQSDQLTLSGTRLTNDDTPAEFSMTMVPTIRNGLLTWTITALVVDDEPESEQAIGQMNDDIVGSWRMFFEGIYRSGNFTAININEDALTLAWDPAFNSDAPSFEAGEGTVMITEEYINGVYQINSPEAYEITDGYVDCQPGQVVVSANLNLASGNVLVQETTFVPRVENGVVSWTVTAVTLNGDPLDQEIIDRFNEVTQGWWGAILAGQARDYEVTELTVTDTQIEVTVVQN